ncbi:DUF86 domain-containing protein [Ammoniphilus sp. CFH 90114]|uniref:HepT-like ribonuclease domain-containing protein n=1 Tax=Ammoniphilus sp. CFH 90114 TaxID=2493665 RepID=UPI00100E7DA2|nr:DUF86 domain-containing protein [Ammoniphilus sp. CFH 90114]RXT02751.1 DUF86 domain-containing protein [Ammoniphilus sp. CFH 90114]
MKNDIVYIKHIIDSIEKIESYTDQLGKEGFIKSGLIQDAVIRNLEIIGEATKNISIEFRKEHQGIPWRNMAGLRDVLIHDYFGVDLEIVWNVVEKELSKVKIELIDLI